MSTATNPIARVEKHTGALRDMAIIVWLGEQPPEGTLLYAGEPAAALPDAIAAAEALEAARASVRAEFALHFPARKREVPAEQQGLFDKFIVRRTDGRDEPGCKHERCEYFVLDVDHDPHARAALTAYANAVEGTHQPLAADLRSRYGLAPPASSTEGWRSLPVGHHASAHEDRSTGLWQEPAIVEPTEGDSGEAGLRFEIGRALSVAIGSVGEDGVVAIDPFDSDDITPLVDAVLDALRDFPVTPPKQSRDGSVRYRALQDMLSLVGLAPSVATMSTWSRGKRRRVFKWASATHLRSSDNHVDVPPRPPFLPEPWKGPYNDTGDVFGGPTPTSF